MSKESIKYPAGSDNVFASNVVDICLLLDPKLAENSLRLSSIYLHQNVLNLYISYTLGTWPRDLNTDFTLGNLSCEVNKKC